MMPRTLVGVLLSLAAGVFLSTGGIALRLIESAELARQAGSELSKNMVMVGAASAYLPVQEGSLLAAIEELFSQKGKKVVVVNRRAFQMGKATAASTENPVSA